MPYASVSELPAAVRERYSAKCQRAFLSAFNGHDGDEESRFKVAHSAARTCMEANDMPLPEAKAVKSWPSIEDVLTEVSARG